MSSRRTKMIRAGGLLLAAVLVVGCASTAPATRVQSESERAQERDGRFEPGRRVITREELEAVGGNQDLLRALSILVPGLTIVGH